MRLMALFSTSFFVGEDGPGWGHLCHTDTVLVFFVCFFVLFMSLLIIAQFKYQKIMVWRIQVMHNFPNTFIQPASFLLYTK